MHNILLLILTSFLGTSLSCLGAEEVPWLRFEGPVSHLKIAPNGLYLALLEGVGLTKKHLKIVELLTKEVFLVAESVTENSFQWTPDGNRLLFQEIEGVLPEKANISLFDAKNKTKTIIKKMDYFADYLNISPLDHKLRAISPNGLIRFKLDYKDSKLAKWQRYLSADAGSFVISHNAIYWVPIGGLAFKKLVSTEMISSFAISPDGSILAWATAKNMIFRVKQGEKPEFIDHGQDPYWHPQDKELIYAGARLIGKKVSSFDLKIMQRNHIKSWITTSQLTSERWPNFLPKTKAIIYTKENTTDIYYQEFPLVKVAKKDFLPSHP